MFGIIIIIIIITGTNYSINRYNKYIQIITSCTINFYYKGDLFRPIFRAILNLFIRTHEKKLQIMYSE